MNNLKIFKSNDFGTVRTIIIDGEPYFVGKDVATILGYTNPQKAIRDHVDAEDKGVNKLFSPGGNQALEYANPYYTVEEFNKKFRLGWDKNKVEKNKKYMDAYCRANYIIVRQCQNKHSKFETRYPFSALETLL